MAWDSKARDLIKYGNQFEAQKLCLEFNRMQNVLSKVKISILKYSCSNLLNRTDLEEVYINHNRAVNECRCLLDYGLY